MISSNNELKAFIQDGYTRTAYFAETRMYPAINITFRPMLVSDQALIYDQIAKQTDARKRQELAAATMQQYLIDWDIEGISHESTRDILKLQPKLFTRMFDVIAGEEAGDPNPDSTESVDLSERLLRDTLANANSEEAQVKN